VAPATRSIRRPSHPTRAVSPSLSETRRPRRLAPALAPLVAALALGLSGCGGGGDQNADPARVAPRGALLYFCVQLRPEGAQKDAVTEIARKVFRVSDPATRIRATIDRKLRESATTRTLSYDDDVKPWLGRRAALVVTSLGAPPAGAVVIASKDDGAARDAVERLAQRARPRARERSYRDVDYWYAPAEATSVGVVGDYVVAGDDGAFRAIVDASKAKGLTDRADYRKAAAAGSGKLAFGLLDSRPALGSLGAALPAGAGGALESLVGAGSGPATLTVDARPDRLSVEAVGRGAHTAHPPSTLLPKLPPDSWLALGIPRVGESLRQAMAQLSGGLGEGIIAAVKQQVRAQTGLDLDRDVLPALGDVAVFARGAGVLTVGGGAVVQTPDRGAAARLVSKLRPFLSRTGRRSGWRVSSASLGGATGLRLTSARFPGAVNVVRKGDRLVIAYGETATRAALSTSGRLADSPDYQAAQASVGGAQPALFVSFGALASLVGAQGTPSAQRASAYVGALRTLAAAARAEGDTQTGRLVVTLR
jgi:Protein of unknown function (DUF3352)